MNARITTFLLSFFFAVFTWTTAPVLAQVTWDGGGDGSSWSDADNWSTNVVPTALDDVEITTTVTIDIDVEAAVNMLLLSRATLEGTEDLTIGGLFTWQSGTLGGTGTVTANGGTSFEGLSFRTLTGRTLELAGSSDWTNGNFNFGDGAVLTIPNSQTLTVNLASSRSIIRTGSITTEPVVNVQGTLILSSTSALASIDVTANIDGAVQLDDGAMLDLGFGSTVTGGLFMAGTAQVEFDGGTHDIAGQLGGLSGVAKGSGMLAAGLGTALIGNAATLNLNPGALPEADLQNNGGGVFINLPLTLSNYFGNGGTLGINDEATITGPFMFEGVNNTLTVAQDVTLNADTITLDGLSTRFNGPGTVNGTLDVVQAFTADNGIQMIWQDGSSIGAGVNFDGSAIATVNTATTVTVSADLIGTDGQLNIGGMLETTGDRRFTTPVQVDPSGTLQVTDTKLELINTTINGTVVTNPGATTELLGSGNLLFNDGATFFGETVFTKGTEPFIPIGQANGTVTFENLTIAAGNFTVDGTTIVTDQFTLMRGFSSPRLIGDGDDAFITQGPTTLAATTGNIASLENIQVVFGGSTTQTGGTLQLDSDASVSVPEGGTYTINLADGDGGFLSSTTPPPLFDVNGNLVVDFPANDFTITNVRLNIGEGGTITFLNGQPNLDVFTQDPSGTFLIDLADPLPRPTATTVNLDGTFIANVPDGVGVEAGDQFEVITTTDANGVFGTWDTTELTGSDGQLITVDYGASTVVIEVVEPADGSISGAKFNDINGDGIFDADESGLEGWTIILEKDGAEVGRTTTDPEGLYTFSELEDGLYEVFEVQQGGWTQTFPVGGVAHLVEVTTGQAVGGIDFGNHLLTADLAVEKMVSPDTVFVGETLTYTVSILNRGPDEATNVTVRDIVFSDSLTFLPTSLPPDCLLSQNAGQLECTIASLAPGETTSIPYQAVTLLAGIVTNLVEVSSDLPDPNSEDNIKVVPATVRGGADLSVEKTVAVEGVPADTVSLGATLTYTVIVTNSGPETAFLVETDDLVFADSLEFIADTVPPNCDLGTATDDDTGLTLSTMHCRVSAILDAGESESVTYQALTKLVGTVSNEVEVSAAPRDLNPSNNIAIATMVVEPPPVGSITGVKFNDLNGNSQRDQGEPGLEGWTISSRDNAGNSSSATTGADGSYIISGLEPGSYLVTEDSQQGWAQTSPPDNGGLYQVTVSARQVVESIDFGNSQSVGGIRGRKFEDIEVGDGDPPGLEGWTIQVLDAEGIVAAEVLTGDQGFYFVPGLAPGTYTVREVQQEGWVQTFPLDNGGIYTVELAAGQTIAPINFGNRNDVGLVTGVKFLDVNGNNQFDEDEPLLEGWMITATNLGEEQFTASTGADGHYFLVLEPGFYTIEEEDRADWTQTFPLDNNGLYETTVSAGSTRANIDFGNAQNNGVLSGAKFDDANANGLFDEGEPLLEGWTINLEKNGVQVTTTTTNSDGLYVFSGLVAGLYTVREVQQDGWVQTFPEGDGVHMVELTSGTEISNLNFGNRLAVGSITGVKFNDLNGNGQRDEGEPGLEGWTILASSEDGAGNALTAADGSYLIAGLTPDTYDVLEVQQDGWVQTAPGGEGIYEIIVEANETNEGVDFGNIRAGSLAGLKFNDLNGDGLRQLDEPGLKDWEIQAVASNGTTTTVVTNTDGEFFFEDLIPGPYTVREVQQEGWAPTFPATISYDATVEAGLVIDGFVFGNTQAFGTISGRKYHDLNNDGEIDLDTEPPLAGWTIEVRDSETGALVASDVTDENGLYFIPTLPPGTYTVQEVLKAGWMQTFPESRTYTITIEPGTYIFSLDFANLQGGIIMGTKFNDLNGNGARDEGEHGLEGWIIGIFGSPTTVDTTDANGNYTFTVPANTYDIIEQAQKGWFATFPKSSHPGGFFDGIHLNLRVEVGQVLEGIDFGNSQAVGAFVGVKFDDRNGNGEFDDVEQRLEEWQIEVLNLEGKVVATRTTLAIGYKVVLPPGTYIVREIQQDGWIQTAPAGGTHTVEVVAGQVFNRLINFGNTQNQGLVTGVKFKDVNGNSQRDEGEPLLEGWMITATNLGEEQFTASTGADGRYALVLDPGFYTIEEEFRDGWTQTFPADNNGIYEVTVTARETRADLDFGNFLSNGFISGVKFNDENANGLFDAGERGLEGWRIRLEEDGAQIATTTTDGDGVYVFSGLNPGAYTVREIQKIGWAQTFPDGDGTHTVHVVSGQGVEGINFGNRLMSTLVSGVKFNDLNGNGVFDEADDVLPGWVIELVDPDGEVVTRDTTNANGLYLFRSVLRRGSYRVREVQQKDWIQTFPTDNGGMHTVFVESGRMEFLGLDFGNTQNQSTLTGFKFNDLNGNAVWDQPEEPGIANWKVMVTDPIAEKSFTTTTDAEGRYQIFVTPGTYTVIEEIRSRWRQTFPNEESPTPHLVINGEYRNVEVEANSTVSALSFGNQRIKADLRAQLTVTPFAGKQAGDPVAIDQGTVVTLEAILFNDGPMDILLSDLVATTLSVTVPTALQIDTDTVVPPIGGIPVMIDSSRVETDGVVVVTYTFEEVPTIGSSPVSFQATAVTAGVVTVTSDVIAEVEDPDLNNNKDIVEVTIGDESVTEVTITDDSGRGSLREALERINNGNADVIELNLPVGSKIDLITALPRLLRRVDLRGTAGAGKGAQSDNFVILDGTNCPAPCNGLTLAGGNSRVNDLQLQNFPGYGLVLETLGSNTIHHNAFIGNGLGGVLITSGDQNILGGTGTDQANIITGNAGPGITVLAGSGHTISANTIEGNTGPGIDLKGDGLTENDNQDADTGPNTLQNFPKITAIATSSTIEGTFHSTPLTSFTLEFFANASCDVSGFGEGMLFLGIAAVVTGADGNAPFSTTFATEADFVSATATAPDGSTSEFSNCLSQDDHIATSTEEETLPMSYTLAQNYPNPFNPVTRIRFVLPEHQQVRLMVFDVLGRQVAVLAEGPYTPGEHEVAWDASRLPSGVYLYQMEAGSFIQTRRMTLLK